MLPDGGNRYDTKHRSLFQQYATENALSWYIYANGLDHLARQAPNGSLYLVTGCDKTRSWGIAAVSRRPSRIQYLSDLWLDRLWREGLPCRLLVARILVLTHEYTPTIPIPLPSKIINAYSCGDSPLQSGKRVS